MQHVGLYLRTYAFSPRQKPIKNVTLDNYPAQISMYCSYYIECIYICIYGYQIGGVQTFFGRKQKRNGNLDMSNFLSVTAGLRSEVLVSEQILFRHADALFPLNLESRHRSWTFFFFFLGTGAHKCKRENLPYPLNPNNWPWPHFYKHATLENYSTLSSVPI